MGRTTTPGTQKSNERKADAILTADWHLMEKGKKLKCRKDSIWDAQWRKVSYIRQLQNKHQCPVILAGDLFHHWKPSPHLLSTAMEILRGMWVCVIAGNHDLPNHNLRLIDKSGLFTMLVSDKVFMWPGLNWGQGKKELTSKELSKYLHWFTNPGVTRKMLMWHELVYRKKPWPTASPTCQAARTIRRVQKWIGKTKLDLLVAGHNHDPFVFKHNGTLLVNPGSLTRYTSKQKKHKPRVYLYYASSNTVTPVFLPIKGRITDEHIKRESKRSKQLDAFVTQLKEDWDISLSFEQNLNKLRESMYISPSILRIIRRATDEQKM